jgi:hypothetical protein
VEQDAVDLRFVLKGDGRDGGRHGKDDVEILAVQDLGGSLLDPLGTCQRLTLRTVPIRAGVIGVPVVTTGVALFEMPAEYGGAARFDLGHDALLSGRQRGGVLTIAVAVAAEHVRYLQRRAGHRRPPSEILRWRGWGHRRYGMWE